MHDRRIRDARIRRFLLLQKPALNLPWQWKSRLPAGRNILEKGALQRLRPDCDDLFPARAFRRFCQAPVKSPGASSPRFSEGCRCAPCFPGDSLRKMPARGSRVPPAWHCRFNGSKKRRLKALLSAGDFLVPLPRQRTVGAACTVRRYVAYWKKGAFMASSLFSRPFFRIYRLLWRLAFPFLKRSSRLSDGWNERMVPGDWLLPDLPQKDGRAADIWLQAASGGEARLAVAICRSFRPDAALRILVTTWTRQGRDVVELALPSLKESHPNLVVAVRFAPFDHPGIVRRALAEASPRLVALLETELWPGLMAACREKNIPVHIFNGRINSSTAHFGRLFSSLMADIAPAAVHAVSRYDQQGFSAIFPCPADRMTNIKFDLAAQTLDAPLPATERLFTAAGPVFLFASVRQGEETRIPGQLSRLYKAVPNAAVIIVPRHLHRVPAWKSVLEDLAFMPMLISELAPGSPLPRKRVLIWDRFGDLPQLYAAARAVFVGGSFGQGGQNFLEALAAGRVPCIGPSAHNFLWALGTGEPSMPSLVEAGLLRVAHTPKDVINIMLEQAASTRDRNTVREAFRTWLLPRQGGSAATAMLMEEALASGPDRPQNDVLQPEH